MISPCFLCRLMCVISGLLPRTSKNRHQSVNEARTGPGYFWRPLWKRFLARYAMVRIRIAVGQCRSSVERISSIIVCNEIDTMSYT